MTAISDRVGGSKATLYGYFPSKEELLRAVLEHDVTAETIRLMQEFPANENLRNGLTRFGIKYLTHRLAALPIANLRTVANQPAESPLAHEFYEGILRPAWTQLAQRFAKLMEEGRLSRADPWIAAMHWKGLNEGELVEKRLIGAISGLEPKEIKKLARLAADAFLKIYGVESPVTSS